MEANQENTIIHVQDHDRIQTNKQQIAMEAKQERIAIPIQYHDRIQANKQQRVRGMKIEQKNNDHLRTMEGEQEKIANPT